MKALLGLRLVQSMGSIKLDSTAKKQVLMVQQYIRVRRWEYTTYPKLAEAVLLADSNNVKRILLNKEGVVVGEHNMPIAVLYQSGNQVAAYVMPTTHSPSVRLVAMSPIVTARIPTSKIIKD